MLSCSDLGDYAQIKMKLIPDIITQTLFNRNRDNKFASWSPIKYFKS